MKEYKKYIAELYDAKSKTDPGLSKYIMLNNWNFASIYLGDNCFGQQVFRRLDSTGNVLLVGETKQERIALVKSIITSLILSNDPEHLKLLLVTSESEDFGGYKNEPHFIDVVINNPDSFYKVICKTKHIMDERYLMFDETVIPKNLEEYNARARANNENILPYIVVFVDDYKKIQMSHGELETTLVTIGQKCRAAGIIIIASQTGTWKQKHNTVLSKNLGTVIAKNGSNIVVDNHLENVCLQANVLTKDKCLLVANYIKENYKKI